MPMRIDMLTVTFSDGSIARLVVHGAPNWLEAIVFAAQALNGEYTVADGDPELPLLPTIGVVWSPLSSQEVQ